MSVQGIFDILNMYSENYKPPVKQVYYSCEVVENRWLCKPGYGSAQTYRCIVPENAVQSTLEKRLAAIPVMVER